MAVPSFDAFLEPLLRALAAAPEGLRASEAYEHVAIRLGLNEADKKITLPKNPQFAYRHRTRWASQYLRWAGYVDSPSRGFWKISADGSLFLANHPNPLTQAEIKHVVEIGERNSKTLPIDEELDVAAADKDVNLVGKTSDRQFGVGVVLAHEARTLSTKRTWLISLGPRSMYWDEFHREGIIAIGWDYLGDLRQYADIGTIRDKIREERETDENPINDGLACWQFVHDMREGDGVFVIKGQYGILGYGVVTSDYRYEEYRPYPNVRSVRWIKRGDWTLKDRFRAKALTEVTPYEEWLQGLRAIVGISTEDVAIETSAYEVMWPPYDLDSAISDLFLSADRVRELLDLCRRKKNLILQGPPGVGKTFVASRLAYLLIGVKDDTRVERVQFHPSYSYEDFVQGLRPAEGGGFERTDGPFLRFARRAVEDPDHAYVLVIDEINRGNISKILGELLSLIEADKREAMYGVTLAYSRDGELRFHLPPNLFLIGTMNTADRALAFVDYALRRRFAFFDIAPAFSSDRFEEDLRRRGVGDELRKTIVDRMSALNNRIREDKTLGDGFCVGHSYFCQAEGPFDLDWFRQIVRYEIVPLLREYWFDNTSGWESERDQLLGD
ncbi:MAG: AAA family ATPase [Deltaproteobacteria bacterium]|nr:AAA family ATPase [Deltaproteobacteria bacterium]